MPQVKSNHECCVLGPVRLTRQNGLVGRYHPRDAFHHARYLAAILPNFLSCLMRCGFSCVFCFVVGGDGIIPPPQLSMPEWQFHPPQHANVMFNGLMSYEKKNIL